MDNLITIHQRNLELLMIDIYKTGHNINPSLMKQLFEKVLPYSLRYSGKMQTDPFEAFERFIKAQKCDACNCRLCRTFHPNLGFLL